MMRCQAKMRICYSNPCANGVRSVRMVATRRAGEAVNAADSRPRMAVG